MSTSPTAYLVDSSIYVFRAWFANGEELVDEQGYPAGAVFGFARFIAQFLELTSASHVSFAFDRSLKNGFRNELYADYKANRAPAPVELKRQFEHAQSLVAALGFHAMASERFEADDLINAMALQARDRGMKICIISLDKDLAQILQDADSVWDFTRNRRVTVNSLSSDPGLRPDQVADYLAIAGDAVDNIPGVQGLGPKTAVRLLQAFDSLEGIFEHLDEVARLPIRGAARAARLLAEQRDKVFVYQKLTLLHPQADLPESHADRLLRVQPDWTLVDAMIDDLRLGESLKTRFRACL